MKYSIIFILIFLSNNSFGQIKIFDEYDFEIGNFSLVFLNVDLVDEEEIEIAIEESIGIPEKKEQTEFVDYREHYIIENPQHLAKIKNSWEGKSIDYMHMCWYDYFIYLLKDSEVISEMRANFECKELLVDGVPYEFDSTLITSHFPMAERILKTEITYQSLNYGRKDYHQIFMNSDMLMVDFYHPNWIDFDGQFEIKFLDYEKTGNVEEKISNLIKESGFDEFGLSWAGTSFGNGNKPNDYWYRIISNEQPDSLIGLEIRKGWVKFNGPFKATYIKRNTPNNPLD